MAGPLAADRVKQTTTTTGTGTLSLTAGTSSTLRTFVSGVGSGNTCYFCVANQSADEWEITQGTVTSGSPDTLSRTTVLYSSNSNNAVSFSAGTKDVFLVAPSVYGLPLIQLPTTFALRYAKEDMLSSTVGNARGTGAVDLQMKRDAATKVASGNYSTIGGGTHNTASGTKATVAGGNGAVASGNYSFVGGGSACQATNTCTTIGGGNNNSSAGNRGTVGGGGNNQSGIHAYATVGGGYGNQTGAAYATVGGGSQNRATGTSAVVAGGAACRAQNGAASIGGGQTNYVDGQYGTVPGGANGYAYNYGQFAYATGNFDNLGDAQMAFYVTRLQTTNGTQTEMLINTAQRMVMPNNTTWAFHILIVARRADADNEGAGYILTGVIDRNGNAASTALIGAVTQTVISEDTAAWDVTADADTTNGSLRLLVTGEAAKTIRWCASVRIVEIGG